MSERPRDEEPPLEIPPFKPAYCGGCAYDVRGLVVHRCPECGELLRRVGVFAVRPSRRSALVRAVLFLLAFIPTAVILRLVCLAPLPNLYTEHASGGLARELDAQTAVVVSFDAVGRSAIWPLGAPDPAVKREWEVGGRDGGHLRGQPVGPADRK